MDPIIQWILEHNIHVDRMTAYIPEHLAEDFTLKFFNLTREEAEVKIIAGIFPVDISRLI